MSNIIDSIQLSGTVYTLSAQTGGGGVPESTFTAYTASTDSRISIDEEVTAAGLNALNEKITPTVELTQAQYDALTTKDPNTYYIITDAQAGDLTNYYTKSETNTLLGGKQATLVSGTNIKTINNESILGSGNIDIQGGGKAVTGGTNISVTTGETADTINCTLNIGNGSGDYSIRTGYATFASKRCSVAEGEQTMSSGICSHAEGYFTQAGGNYSHAEGFHTIAIGNSSHAEGYYSKASGDTSHAEGSSTQANGSYSHAEGFGAKANGSYSHAEGGATNANGDNSHAEGDTTTAKGTCSHTEGWYTIANNQSEHASGQYNVSSSASTTFGHSGNTLFSVGNGELIRKNRHNAFEIRQSGDIYIVNTDDTSTSNYDEKPMVRLQDYIGGSSITVDSALDSSSTHPVQNKTLYDELRIVEAPTETVLQWDQHDGGQSTNYPSGCTKVMITVDEQQMDSGSFTLIDSSYDSYASFGIESLGGTITVTNYFGDYTYSISGNVVTIEYPTYTNVWQIQTSYDNYWTWKAIVNNATPLIDKVIENEEVTAAALNVLNDKIGDIETLLSQI